MSFIKEQQQDRRGHEENGKLKQKDERK